MMDNYIFGQWQKGAGAPFSSVNPATGVTVWQGNMASHEDTQYAFESAKSAAHAFANLDFTSRVNLVSAFAAIVETKKQILATIISEETGKPFWESLTEVASVINKIAISIQAYQTRTHESESTTPDATAYTRYKPHGVVAVLGAFNFPAHLSNGHIVPALLAGNTIIYKPSELTPKVAECIMSCWHEAGLPKGVINCIQGDATVAQSLLNLDIQGVYFTGSYNTGVKINQQFATRPHVILALEMGGNNPLVIDNIKDIEAAVYQCVISTVITAGQRCTCARRLIIPNSSIGDAFLSRYLEVVTHLKIGHYQQKPEPFMGPVIRASHAVSHLTQQSTLIDMGGINLKTMAHLEKNTGFLSVGVIDMTKALPFDDEIFAPLVQVYRYHDFNEAIQLANQTQYGLSAGLFSDDEHRYRQFYHEVNAGLINWNRPTTGAVGTLPFGGIGRSGNHRPSAYFASDYCAYPIASLEQPLLAMPATRLPGIS